MLALLIIAWFFAAFGLFISSVNFYLSKLRYPIHKWRHGSDPEKWISGYPVFGSLFLWISAGIFVLSGYRGHAILMLAASLFDTGGLHWFAYTMLRYEWWEKRKEKMNGNT